MATVVSTKVCHDLLGGDVPQAIVDRGRVPRTLHRLSSTEHQYSEAQRPRLNFLFDEDIFRERAARYIASGADGRVPPGFPPRVEGARAWSGKEYADETTYAVTLDSADLREVEDALEIFKAQGEDVGPGQVCRANFPLPTLGPRLRAMALTIFHGRGFVLIRGLNPAKYSSVENMVIFNGITGYLAEKRGRQDDFGNMVVHMRDMRRDIHAPLRPTYTQDALPFHNDAAEVIAMYGVHAADEGGDTTFASCATIYNELAATRPDVLRTMAEPDWKYPEDTEPSGWTPRALLFPSPRGPYWFFSRRRLTGLPGLALTAGLPPMSERQAEALDVFELTARARGFAVRLRPGDVFVFHNLALVHGRTAFRDGAGTAGRHVMRTFLHDGRLSWGPPGLAAAWSRLYDGPGPRIWRTVDGVEVGHILHDGDRCV